VVADVIACDLSRFHVVGKKLNPGCARVDSTNKTSQMCGIAGTIRFDGDATATDREAVSRMLTLQQRRGPDGDGIYSDGPTVLGHRRLSIIDLSDAGAQPMSNETGDVWLIFNGEIYNHHELRQSLISGHCFRSNCDTEVLIHGYEEWGPEGLLRRLRGMFAFAIYDARGRAGDRSEPFFFAARDRLGIKPLYYTVGRDRLAFASEVKALVQSGLSAGEPDVSALAAFLCLGSIPSPRTWQKDVHCLAPGHSLFVDRRGVEIRKYWELSYEGDSKAEIAAILQDSVDRHLVADVPTGVFLSGGVDSAGIACLAARNRRAPVSTLTIAFDEREFSEAAEARQFAEAFGTDHHEIRVTGTDFEEEIPRFLAAMDQPTADGVNTYFVSRAASRAGLKVVLSGLGGDEVFLGYPHYRPLVGGAGGGLLGGFMRSPDLIRRMIGFGASMYGRNGGGEKWERFDYCGGRPFHESLYLLVRGFFPPARVGRMLGMAPTELNRSLEESFATIRMPGANGHVDPNRFHFLEMKRYLHDQLLRDSDVFSMAHSIELRVPLLDDPLVEAGCRIAPRDRVAAGINKPKLVEGFGHPAIRKAAARPKRGFTFPFARWMAANAGRFEESALAGNQLDHNSVRDCWKEFRAGRLHWSRAWSTVVMASLARQTAAV
jgi:asparagine synthase (glutamine-hydrolysing)